MDYTTLHYNLISKLKTMIFTAQAYLVTEVTRALDGYISDVTNSIGKSTREQNLPTSVSSKDDVVGNYYFIFF